MLNNYDFLQFDERYANFKRSDLGEELNELLLVASRLKIPILLLIEGWESSGRGRIINDLTRELDHRFVRVEVFDQKADIDFKHPNVWRYWQKIPNNQEMVIYDQSFYAQVFKRDAKNTKQLKQRAEELLDMEKMLLADGTIIIKFFLNIQEETQAKRIKDLEAKPYRQHLLSEEDYQQNKAYQEHLEWFSRVLNKTNIPQSPWQLINAEDRKLAAKTVLGITIREIIAGIERVTLARERKHLADRDFVLSDKQLTQYDLEESLADEIYDEVLEKLQEEAAQLVYECYTKQIAIILAFEGVDAAGKGGAIQRLTREIDPRSYKIYGIKAPTELELSYHYLWRFQTKFPADGDMVIFDRSWYGRVLVERIEGFASLAEWERAYAEIVAMERDLTNHGNILLKFFLFIDEDEQAKRFQERISEPEKNYKITAEDLRNREKWGDYMLAYEEMLIRTNHEQAPWIIVASNDKRWARVKVLKEFIAHVKEHLAKKK